MVTRSCGSCTKCCEGYLTANIRGHEMYPNKPCFFVTLNKGCNDYDNRPRNPCRIFNCEWIKDLEFPDELSPLNSGVIISEYSVMGMDFLRISPAPNMPTKEQLKIFILYVLKNNKRASFFYDGIERLIGDIMFEDAMNRYYKKDTPMKILIHTKRFNFTNEEYIDSILKELK